MHYPGYKSDLIYFIYFSHSEYFLLHFIVLKIWYLCIYFSALKYFESNPLLMVKELLF